MKTNAAAVKAQILGLLAQLETEQRDHLADAKRILSSFLDGRNKNTRKGYVQDLERYQRYAKAQTVEAALADLLKMSQGEINEAALRFQRTLGKSTLSAATVNRSLLVLRLVLKSARRLGLSTLSIEIDRLRAELSRDVSGPPVEDIIGVLDRLGRQAAEDAALRTGTASHNRDRRPVCLRDRAMIGLCFYAGLRRSEIINLDMEHVSKDRSALAIRAKGKRALQSIALSETASRLLTDWLEERGRTPGPVFHTVGTHARRHNKLRRIDPAVFYRRIRDLGLKRPHGLRHTAITVALKESDIRQVQQFARHAAIATTTFYDDNRHAHAATVSARLDDMTPKPEQKRSGPAKRLLLKS